MARSIPGAADHSLRTTVGLLRRALEPDLERGPDSRFVLSKRPGYMLDRRAGWDVDAWRFEEHRTRAEASWEAGKTDEAVEECRAALDLARGDFLSEDPYEDWAMGARQEFRVSRLSVFGSAVGVHGP